ncbi:MAG: helix-turn-helix domain-containing protein [Oscillospiraceae bacterium]
MPEYIHENIFDDTHLESYFSVIEHNDYYVPAHWHNHAEILLITAGTLSASISSRKFELSQGDMLVVGPQDIHSTGSDGSTSYILLQISYELLKRSMPDFDIIRFREYYGAEQGGQMKKYLGEMQRIHAAKEDGYQLKFSALLYELMYLLYKDAERLTAQDKNRTTRDIKRVEQVMRYVKQNYAQHISVSDAAAEVSISPEYFCRIFKAHTGQTFLEYVNSVRMVYFYNDLMTSEDTVTKLMEKNGITNYKVFLRVFRRTYGAPPQRLRKTLQEK